ncbi:MAG: hypothetical protein COX41_01770 [Candidatus Omnitrophica bacterium CG23_combo_of_CG06-09_8_20_14_all_41_10]|uniref:Single cache domain-containing protein n=1 Tax=Candidatus Sherwoodlollariibacterium unditelluris TaxID=1974757 RepID=A0A2G9YK90_9BACT|nr:MAG: hypothetical protein COX41_01770 [Candidatus Omnitrophica bacterium CG23_combo_of_CG06-09_8_20_14_all_41_10]
MFKYIPLNARYILLFISAILLVGVILMLGWVNHRDFKRSVINAELRELLVIAKSASHDIESGVVGIKQEPQRIDKLIQHINNEEKFTTFVMDNKHIILSDPVKSHVGKNILEVGKEVLNAQELAMLNTFVEKFDSSSSGTAVLFFPSRDQSPKKEMKLFSFAHLQGQNGLYSVVVTERLSSLIGPLHRNLRDVLVLVGLFFLIFLASGYIFYRNQKKRIQMETTSRALEIINKQLHCEIEDYRCIERSLKNNKRKSVNAKD